MSIVAATTSLAIGAGAVFGTLRRKAKEARLVKTAPSPAQTKQSGTCAGESAGSAR